MKRTVLHIHFWADIRNSAGSVEKVITSFASQGQTWQHKIACLGRPGTAPYRYHDVLILPFWEDRLKNRALNKMLRLNAYSYSTLVSVIRRERPDVLHFHNRQELVDQVVRRLPYRPKIAVHFHRHFANPVVPAAADLLVFPSRTTAQYIRSATNTSKPFRVVFNPLSRELLAHAVQDGGLPEKRGGGAVILYGGGRNPIKGIHELIQAFTQMQCQSATLVLAGRGVETLGVRHPRIEVVGEMAADAFFERMQQSDIVAMPSYDEPFGLIAQEAMLLRRLLVVANSGGARRIHGRELRRHRVSTFGRCPGGGPRSGSRDPRRSATVSRDGRCGPATGASFHARGGMPRTGGSLFGNRAIRSNVMP